MKNSIVGLKNLREHMETYISQVEKGKSFIVVRRSKPLFKISSIEEDDEIWERVVDFTKTKKGGIAIAELIKRL